MSNLEKALQKALSARNKAISKTEDQDTSQPVSIDHDRAITAHIPLMNEISIRDKMELEQKNIIYPDMSNGKVVDQFREIRTRIYQALLHNNSPILVTAVSANAGNTFVTKNIGAAIALDDARTSLIVDCNLTNSGLNELLQDEDREHPGITDYIDSDVLVEDILAPVGIKRMRLIAAGAKKESMTDYLTSPKLKALFSELQTRYSDRVILVDSPSINDAADAKILANLFSHVVLVVPYRKVTESQVINAIKAIGKEKIIGIVINREPQFLSLFKTSAK